MCVWVSVLGGSNVLSHHLTIASLVKEASVSLNGRPSVCGGEKVDSKEDYVGCVVSPDEEGRAQARRGRGK